MKFFIYYSNGYFESVEKINMVFVHMVEVGAAKFILDVEAGEVYLPTGEGSHRRVKVTEVKGLI